MMQYLRRLAGHVLIIAVVELKMEEELETTFATWGWEVFFTELQSFLAIINREVARSVTREYAQFVTERLRTCVQALSALCQQLESDRDGDISEVHSALRDLKECCLSLHVVWSYRLDLLDSIYLNRDPSVVGTSTKLPSTFFSSSRSW